MSTGAPLASVIIRTKDSSSTLGRVLAAVRAQSVASEIIIVDSGSSDATLAIARAEAQRTITIAPERFSYGGALNAGAAVARGPFHFALSSHSFPPDETWIERSLQMYRRANVAATSGAPTLPCSSQRLHGTHHQSYREALSTPDWGMSNTGSSWRAAVWREFPFSEQLGACEDKEWGLRVLAAGWRIAIDPSLSVSDRHRRAEGLLALYARAHREQEAIASFVDLPPYTLQELIRQWFSDVPRERRSLAWRRRVNYFRAVELLAKYRALRACGQRELRCARAREPTANPQPRAGTGTR